MHWQFSFLNKTMPQPETVCEDILLNRFYLAWYYKHVFGCGLPLVAPHFLCLALWSPSPSHPFDPITIHGSKHGELRVPLHWCANGMHIVMTMLANRIRNISHLLHWENQSLVLPQSYQKELLSIHYDVNISGIIPNHWTRCRWAAIFEQANVECNVL